MVLAAAKNTYLLFLQSGEINLHTYSLNAHCTVQPAQHPAGLIPQNLSRISPDQVEDQHDGCPPVMALERFPVSAVFAVDPSLTQIPSSRLCRLSQQSQLCVDAA